MSEGILIAFVGFVSAIVCAAIAGFATIAAAHIKDGKVQFPPCSFIGLASSIGAGVGLVFGIIFGAAFLQQTSVQIPQSTEAKTNPFVIVVTATPSSINQRASPNLQSSSSSQPPNLVHLQVGDNKTLADGWVWVCTGDFAASNSSGERTEYFDHVASTGLVLVLDADSRIALSGPTDMSPGHDIGDCAAFPIERKGAATNPAVSAQLSGGCGSNCLSVRVVELGAGGQVLADYWKP